MNLLPANPVLVASILPMTCEFLRSRGCPAVSRDPAEVLCGALRRFVSARPGGYREAVGYVEMLKAARSAHAAAGGDLGWDVYAAADAALATAAY